jgi:predicted nucleic acid-binding Zn ribbon protein
MNRQLREKILAEWRGLPQKPPQPDRTVSVAEGLKKVMHGLGLDERLHEAQMLQCWKEIVGEFIAGHSCPTRLKDGVLYVQVIQPAVLYELDRELKPQILKKLKKQFGGKVIREIRFRTGG